MPKMPQGKKGLYVYISEEVWEKLISLVKRKYDGLRGLSQEVEEAIKEWLEKHSESSVTYVDEKSSNSSSRVLHVFNQIKSYLTSKYGYVTFHNVPLKHLQEAIIFCRGSHPSTVKRWLRAFEMAGLMTPIRGNIFTLKD